MREKLKPCPFCGINDWRYHAYFSGTKIRKCGECGIIVDESTINTRLIEDDLRKRIAELEAEIDIRKDQLREAKNILIDKNLQIDSLYEEGYKLQQRIADLEGLAQQHWECRS